MAKNKNGKASKPQSRTRPQELARREEEKPLAVSLSPFSFVGRVMEEMDRLAGDFGFG